MRTYFADIEGMIDRSSFLYHQDFDTDEAAVTHFRRVFGDRVEMICIRAKDKFISVYEKPDLFPLAEEIIPVNYRALLKKYINHIISNEGVSFIDDTHNYLRGRFSDREWEELQVLDREVLDGDA